jgi:prepilin-type N-terminal cleavage/methylation domain-containing protein
MNCLTPAKTHTWRSGFSLLEVVISLFLVGTVMVVALQALTAATTGRVRNGNQGQAAHLAHALLEEILDQAYLEPVDTAAFGPETGETTGGTRAAFDDVDDYHGWSASPPESKAGTDLPLSTAWTRTAAVQWVQPTNINVNSPIDGGLKQILVTVKYKGVAVAVLSAVVTKSRQVLPAKVP